jgi:hypothetical protein
MSAGLARFHTAGNLNGSRVEQEFLCKRGFARIWVRNDGKATAS